MQYFSLQDSNTLVDGVESAHGLQHEVRVARVIYRLSRTHGQSIDESISEDRCSI